MWNSLSTRIAATLATSSELLLHYHNMDKLELTLCVFAVGGASFSTVVQAPNTRMDVVIRECQGLDHRMQDSHSDFWKVYIIDSDFPVPEHYDADGHVRLVRLPSNLHKTMVNKRSRLSDYFPTQPDSSRGNLLIMLPGAYLLSLA
jgi:hypothetical protein